MSRKILPITLYALMIGALPACADQLPLFSQVFIDSTASLCLRDQNVQRELKLDDNDLRQLEKLSVTFAPKYGEQIKKLAKLEAAEASAEQKKIAAALVVEINKEVAKLLKAEQVTRLKQIDRQLRGAAAYEDPEVQKALGFTVAQNKKLDELRDKYEHKLARLRRIASGVDTPKNDVSDREREELLQTTPLQLRRIHEQEARNLLTNEQRDKWNALVGPTFPAKDKKK
jgi:hypothetical protein